MLAQALRVVEAARALSPRKGSLGIYSLACPPVEYASRVRELADALQGFDRATGTSDDPPAILGRLVGHLSGRGEDVPGLFEALGIDVPRSARSTVALADLLPQPGEIGVPDRLKDVSVSRQSVENGAAVLGIEPDPPERWERSDPLDPEDGPPPMDPLSSPPEPDDGEEPSPPEPDRHPSSDLGMVLAIEQRLSTLGERHGWSQRLRRLDIAWREVRDALADAGKGTSATYLVTAATLSALAEVATEVAAIEAGADPDLEDALPPAPGR